ncbi:MAG: hypothetical protein EOP04_16105 [Proteobacteria bacterium]|nr:MAG: hypothetical protein EOP04_16105 [Pseudomonadota bacterium]
MKKFYAIFVLVVALSRGASGDVSEINCLEKIPQLICEVAPPLREQDRYVDGRPCLAVDTQFYVKQITRAFNSYPKFVQRLGCSLKRIYIEQNFFGPAWSSPVDENLPTEILIGLRKKDLDEGADFQIFSTWFEQQTFGGSGRFVPPSEFPLVTIRPRKWAKEPSLIFTLLHELAHALDYLRGYNLPKEHAEYLTSWTHIAWTDLDKVREEFDFPYRKSICLNGCSGDFIEPRQAHVVYREMAMAGFISQLSTTNAREDFADTFAYYVLDRFMQVNVSVRANGFDYSINKTLASPKFRVKIAFIDHVIAGLNKKSILKYRHP